MSKTIHGVLVDPIENKAVEMTVEDSLKSLYNLLDCRLIEVAERRIGVRNRHYYTIICDEQGTFVEDPYISAINDLGQAMLVGKLFICNTDGEGNFSDLTEKQIANALDKCMQMSTRKHPEPYYMLTQCEY